MTRLPLVLASTLLLTHAALAQDVIRVRGTVASISGDTLVINGRSATTSVDFPATGVVTAATEADLAHIKPGLFIGTAAVRQPDGTLRALEVHIFPESMRGTGEGYRPWDLGPQSTMTNGSVGQITGADGRTITVDYKGGQQSVTVPPDVPVVEYEPGTRDLLKPGASVVAQATKGPDGALHAARVTVAVGNAKLGM